MGLRKPIATTSKQVLNHIDGFKKGRLIEAFNNLSQWTKQGGYQQSIDSTIGKLKLESDGTPVFSRKTVSLNLSGCKVLKFRVYVYDLSNLSKFTLYLANNTGYTDYLYYAINASACVEGWNTFAIDTSKFSVAGAGSFTNDIVSMQVRVEALSGTNSAVTFDTLIRDETQKAKLLFTFDDGWGTQYTEAFKRMSKKGIVGTIAVVPSLVNTSGYVTLAQLQEIYDYGWDLVNHTMNHVNLKNVDSATIRSEIADGEQWLNSNGFTRASNIVFYPQGGYKDEVITEMASRRAGRSIVEAIEPGSPSDKYKIKIRNVINTVTPTTVQGWIDEAINTGGTLILLWHILTSPADTSTKYTPTDFQTIVDYAHSKRDQIDILTITEYLDRCGL